MEMQPDMPGETVPISKSELQEAASALHKHVTVEYWGYAISEGGKGLSPGS
jgi:hypothetical protein